MWPEGQWDRDRGGPCFWYKRWELTSKRERRGGPELNWGRGTRLKWGICKCELFDRSNWCWWQRVGKRSWGRWQGMSKWCKGSWKSNRYWSSWQSVSNRDRGGNWNRKRGSNWECMSRWRKNRASRCQVRLGSVRHGLSFVLDVGDVSVLVGDVRDDLGAAVRKRDPVLSGCLVAVPDLRVGEVVTAVVVPNRVTEGVVGGALKII